MSTTVAIGAQPVSAGPFGRAHIRADVPFRVNGTLFAAGVLHGLAHDEEDREVNVRAIGARTGTLYVYPRRGLGKDST